MALLLQLCLCVLTLIQVTSSQPMYDCRYNMHLQLTVNQLERDVAELKAAIGYNAGKGIR